MKDLVAELETSVRDEIVLNTNAFLRWNFTKYPSILVHEVTHNRHYNLGIKFSKDWNLAVFGQLLPLHLELQRTKLNNSEDLGFVSKYAKEHFLARKLGKKPTYTFSRKPRTKLKFRSLEGINDLDVEFESKAQSKKIKKRDLNRFLYFFPNSLLDDLKQPNILFKHDIPHGGLFRRLSGGNWEGFRYLVEDVAESNSFFHAAAQLPRYYTNTIKLLNENWRTKARLEILMEYDFVDYEDYSRLTDKSFLKEYSS